MLTVIEGYYNGSQIVMDESVPLRKGQRVIVTILEPLAEETGKGYDLKKYMGRGERLFKHDAGDYVKELRSDDRL